MFIISPAEVQKSKISFIGQNSSFDRSTVLSRVLGESPSLLQLTLVAGIPWLVAPSLHPLPLFSHHLLLCLSNLPLPPLPGHLYGMWTHTGNSKNVKKLPHKVTCTGCRDQNHHNKREKIRPKNSIYFPSFVSLFLNKCLQKTCYTLGIH